EYDYVSLALRRQATCRTSFHFPKHRGIEYNRRRAFLGETRVLRWAVLPLGLLVASLGAADAPSPLPKDTLPANLPCDKVPLGLDMRLFPKDNPLTEARVRLGRKLFFDPILSGDNTVACATCHQPSHGFSSAEAKPRGIRGQQLSRRAPTLVHRAYVSAFFWDGRCVWLGDPGL